MAHVYTGFEDRLGTKRKRNLKEPEDSTMDDDRQHKRSNFTRLPFRTSPTVSHDRIRQHSSTEVSRPLTPVDSSDDEAYGQADNAWSHRRVTSLTNRRSPTHNLTPVSIQTDTTVDADMEMYSLIPPGTKVGSHTTNSYINSLCTPTTLSAERAPTPITSNFNIYEDRQKNRIHHINPHTMLSPVMAEESYLPSPIEPDEMFMNTDAETTMRMEHASNGFGALSVSCNDDMMEYAAVSDASVAANRSRGGRGTNSKSPRLHMGFRADCEKCQQRVPGHYSHIIWD